MNNVIEHRTQSLARPQVAEHRAGNRLSAYDFLKQLASDDALRAQVEKAPLATILAHGFDIDASAIPAGGVKLPSKQAIGTYLDMADSRLLESTAIVIVFKI